MKWTRSIPIASVLAVGAIAFTLRTVATAPAPDASAAHAFDGATIVAICDAANTADIETGQRAAKRGSTKPIRDFGGMLSRDHKVVRHQGRDLAKKLGVAPTPPKDDDSARQHDMIMKKLSAVSGVDVRGAPGCGEEPVRERRAGGNVIRQAGDATAYCRSLR